MADPEASDHDQLVLPADDFVEDADTEAIFAPELPHILLAAPERPPPPPGRAPAGARKTDGTALSARHQGMERWFMGLALCVLGTGYIAYQVLSDTALPGYGNVPSAADSHVGGKAPEAVSKGETIHKLPQSASAAAPPPAPPPAIEPDRMVAVVEVTVVEPPAIDAAQAPAVPEQNEPREIDAVEAAGDDPASAIVVAPASGLKVIRDCNQCPELVVVPAGRFLMGSPAAEPGHRQHEAPQHEVAIAAPFAIGRFEVTFAEWDICAEEGGCRHRAHDEGWGRKRMPAINVSWQDIAGQFLPWLARKSGKPYRLPSEAEWEYAARASPGLALNAAYGASGEVSALCGFANAAGGLTQGSGTSWKGIDCRDGFANTAPVGSFKPSPWGLHDLAGNVWEWVEDCWNETYGTAPTDGSAWTSGDCGLRVVRGGSWSSATEKFRSADRGWNRPDGRSPSIGFRVARKL
jgi:formylglycine-generating enzyme required for sulfatase activity